MILIFDLDDTLYPERSFVESGFAAVARMLEDAFGWDKSTSLREMLEILNEKGRGAVFNELLANKGRLSAQLVQRCLQTYRQHPPDISLDPEARALLDSLRGRRVYLVTDGNKIVQANKVRSLRIEQYFKKIFITHRYGRQNAKPSVYCFELIRKRERCDWTQMAYIGDNPAKDFVNLNPLGVTTVRVLTGEHANTTVLPDHDAKFSIGSIGQLQSVPNLITI